MTGATRETLIKIYGTLLRAGWDRAGGEEVFDPGGVDAPRAAAGVLPAAPVAVMDEESIRELKEEITRLLEGESPSLPPLQTREGREKRSG